MQGVDRIALSRALDSPAATKRRISRLNVGGETIWLKDFAQLSPPKWDRLQRATVLVTRLQILRPVPSLAGIPGAEHEIEAMRRFREIGARVPDLLWASEARIAISDIGETLRDIERRGGERALRAPVLSAAHELSRIHSHGLVHGRPILRNMTWDGETVGFIDFEEEPIAVMPADSAQARDVLLLLMSLGRRSGSELMRTVFDACSSGITPGVKAELQRAARFARPFAGALGRILRRSGNRDLTALLQALAVVNDGL